MAPDRIVADIRREIAHPYFWIGGDTLGLKT